MTVHPAQAPAPKLRSVSTAARRRLGQGAQRLAVMGGLAGLLAGAMVVGVGAPAHAVELDDIRSYMLTVPPSVATGSTATETLAYRDVARNRPGVTLAPVTDISPLGAAGKSLYGGDIGLQLLDAGDGTYVQRVTGANPWPKADGRPAHVPQSEWDACAAGPKTLLGGLRQLADTITGGNACANITELWGGKVGEDWQGPLMPGSDELPLEGSATGLSFTIGEPVFSTTTVGHDGYVLGWLYPITYTADWQAIDAIYIGGKVRTRDADGLVGTAVRSLTSVTRLGLTPRNWLVPGQYCGATICANPSAGSVNLAAGQMGTLDRISIQTFNRVGSGTSLTGVDFADTVGYSNLHPSLAGEPTAPEPEPKAAQLRTTVTWCTPDGSECGEVECTTDGFIQKAGERIPLPCSPPKVGGGQVETGRLVELLAEGETGYKAGTKPERQVWKAHPRAPYTDWKATDDECGKNKRCLLDLQRSGKSCFDDPSNCERWEDDAKTAPQDFECQYNGRPVPMSECGVYGPTFKPENRDAGNAYSPAPGQTGGGTSAPSKPGDLGGGPAPGDAECFPEGYAPSNPVDWALRPAQCALQWAFVPSDGAVEAAQGKIGAAYAGSGVAALGDALGSVSGLFETGSSCAGLPFGFDVLGVSFHERLFEACEPPWDGVANFTNNLLVGVISLAGFLAIFRYAAALFGFVGPGGSHEHAARAAERQAAT